MDNFYDSRLPRNEHEVNAVINFLRKNQNATPESVRKIMLNQAGVKNNITIKSRIPKNQIRTVYIINITF